MMLAVGLVLLVAGMLWRLVQVWPRLRGPGAGRRRRGQPVRTLVVLGSGGHTAEMLPVAEALDPVRHRLVFVAADERSCAKVAGRETRRIPRARHVGQGWLSSAASTAWALAHSALLVLRLRPELVLCNGPAICVPIALATLPLRLVGGREAVKVVFIESGCRVERLSLSGRIMLWLSDVFFVQWKELQERVPGSICIGRTL